MPTSAELRSQRAAIVAQSRQLVDRATTENREMTAEETQQFDRMIADADRLNGEIRSLERREWVELQEAEQRASQGRQVPPAAGQVRSRQNEPTEHDRREAIRAWALTGKNRIMADADQLHRASLCGINLHSDTLSLRALSKGTASAGGNAVPVSMVNAIDKALKFFAPIRGVCSTLVTDSGSDLDYPRVTDVANSASIVSEAGTIVVNADPTFSKVTMKAWKYATTIVKVSLELLQDSAVDVEQLLGSLLGERMGRGQAAHFVTGSGSGQPQGLATAATAGVNLASGNAITADKMIDLIYSVDRAYRDGASFLTHDETVAALVKLKDDNGQYLWSPGLMAGEPDRFKNHPVIVSNDITSITTPGDNQPLVLFGDMKNYLVRDVRGSQDVIRLNELYAATAEVGFVLHQRTDGRMIGQTGCVKSLNSYDAA